MPIFVFQEKYITLFHRQDEYDFFKTFFDTIWNSIILYHHCSGIALVYPLLVINTHPFSLEVAIYFFSVLPEGIWILSNVHDKSTAIAVSFRLMFLCACTCVFPSRLETQRKKIKVIQNTCLLKVFLFYVLFNLSFPSYLYLWKNSQHLVYEFCISKRQYKTVTFLFLQE